MTDIDEYIVDKITADLIRIEKTITNIREHIKSYMLTKDEENGQATISTTTQSPSEADSK